MVNFSELPMFRILLLFCLSLMAAVFLPMLPVVALILGSVSLIVISLFTLIPFFYKKYEWRWVYGLFFCLLTFCLTQVYVFVYSSINKPNHFLRYTTENTLYLIRLTESCHQKNNSYRVNGEVKAIIRNGVITNCSGEVLINIVSKGISKVPVYADYLLTNAKVEEIATPQNPSQFDYKEYLSFHNIYSRFTLTKSNYYPTNFNDANPILKASYTLRDNLVEKLKVFFISREELAVASALLVGFEDYLDPEIIQAFSSTGALHVLSVSGMHVGLVFVCLSWLLSFMDKKRWLLLIKYSILVAFIWFYALMTGFSPSVLRSVVMVSLVIISKVRKRDADTLNTMLGSAFLLLCYNPFYITEVGFQLSYLAVFGIVYLHPMLAQRYVAPNKIMHWIWQLTSVSITAQLMTFPLGLLYFHQFPLLFLISNLIIIPLTTLIIYIGIGALLLFFLPALSDLLWQAAYYITYFLNMIVKFIDSLKSLTLNGLSITVFETWLIYTLIGFAVGFLVYRNRKMLFASLSICLVLIKLQIIEKNEQVHQKKMIVYSIPGKTAIDIISGNEHLFIASSALSGNSNQMRFFVLHNWDDLGLNAPTIVNADSCNAVNFTSKKFSVNKGFISFHNQTIFVADKYITKNSSEKKSEIDYLIIRKGYKGKVENVLSYFNATHVILDSSVPTYKINLFVAELKYKGIDFYATTESGAFIKDL